jgi:hypothetical protein
MRYPPCGKGATEKSGRFAETASHLLRVLPRPPHRTTSAKAFGEQAENVRLVDC